MKRLLLCCVVAVLSVLVAASAHAQANLSFSGGSGTPLSITFSQPEIFTITGTAATAPVFVVQGLGNLFPNENGVNGAGVSGTVTFQINGGTQLVLDTVRSGFTGGNTVATDTYFFGTLPGVTTGSVVRLGAGTETTTGNYAAAAPSKGTFNVFIADGSTGSAVSPNGMAVPHRHADMLFARLFRQFAGATDTASAWSDAITAVPAASGARQ